VDSLALPPLRTVLKRVDPFVEPLVCVRGSSRPGCVVFYKDQSLSLFLRIVGETEVAGVWRLKNILEG
jgi:hypothetical protein